MAKYIIGSLLIVVAWVTWWFFELELWIPIVSTVVVVLAVVGLIVLKILRARRAARQLEEALVQQGQQQAKGMRPDLQAEMHEMQAEFDKAVSALKTSKLGKGKAALYALPWQIIIGPPGAGKSTALRNSGLNFPYLSATGGGVKGIGGTRNCDWWLTNEGVILDTAGRWTTQEEDRDEWLGFLDLIKRYRKKKPLNGVIVAVSVTDLIAKNEQDVALLASRIRERLDEVMERLQMSMPVYVLFTKCDLLPGFVETFGNLSRTDRSAIWGFTAPVMKPIDDVGGYFDQRFGELADALERRCLYRMSEERRLSSRERIFSFPHQFEQIRKNLGDFVTHLFQSNVFRETPILRGAYFTSGTQEGRPIDMVMHRMARSFGVESVATLADPVVEQKSYFLGDLFGDVVFKDSDIAVRSPLEQKRQRRQKILVFAAIMTVAILVSSVPTYAYIESSALLSQTKDAVEATGPHLRGEGVLEIDGIEPLRTVNSELEEGPSVFARLGMYRGDVIEPYVHALYAKTLRDRVVSPLVTEDVTRMLNFGRSYEAMADAKPTPDEYANMYETLRVHLLLTGPRGEYEPEFDEEIVGWLTERIAKRWAEQLEIPPGHTHYDRVEEATRFFVESLASDPQLALERNDQAVQYVRTTLARVSLQDVVLGAIVRELDGQGYDLSLVRITTQPIEGVTASEQIRGAFTRRAWEEKVRDMLEDPASRFAHDQWVLGRTAPSQQRDDILRLRSHYFRNYIQEWERFLNSVRVEVPANEEARRELMRQLTHGSVTAYQRLWRQVQYNLRLNPAEEEQLSRGAQRGISNVVRRGTQALRTKGIAGRVLGQAADTQLRSELESRPRGQRLQDPTAYVMDYDVRDHFEGFITYGVHLEGDANTRARSLDHYLEELKYVLQTMQNQEDVNARLATARTDTETRIARQDSDWHDTIRRMVMPPLSMAVVTPAEPADEEPAPRPRRRRRWR